MIGKRIFWRLFLSYIILLVIALCIISLIYQTSIQSMQNSLIRQSYNSLTEISNTVDTIATNVENFATTVLLDKDISFFLSLNNIEINSAAVSEISRLTNTLKKYNQNYYLAQNIYIISDLNNFVLFSDIAVRHTELFHNSIFYFTGMDYDEFNEFSRSPNFSNGFYVFTCGDNADRREIVYILKVPAEIAPSGSILIRINTASILDLLQFACIGDSSQAFLLDSKEKILAHYTNGDTDYSVETLLAEYSTSGQRSFLSRQYLITGVELARGWRLFSVIPNKAVLSDVYSARQSIIGISLILVILGIVISYLLTRKKARLLGDVVNSLSSATDCTIPKKQSEYVIIEEAVSRLVRNQSSFRTLNESQRMLIRNELIRRLIFEEYRHLDDLKELIATSDINWIGQKFGVIIVYFNMCVITENEILTLINHFDDCLSVHSCGPYCFYRTDDSHLIILFVPKTSCTEENWYEFSDKAAKSMSHFIQSDYQATFCLSKLYDRLADVHQAFEEAMVISEHANAFRKNYSILRFSDLPNLDEFYYYPLDVELRLMQLVKNGHLEELKKLLNMIYEENFKSRVLSMAMTRQLVFQMRGTAVRCLQTVSSNERISMQMKELSHETTIDGIFNYVIKISTEICKINNDTSLQEELLFMKVISEKIELGFSDCNFSIHQIAESLNTNVNTLYRFIRNHYDHTFWEMLENTRIQKACEQMQKGTVSINQIAERVGYNSDNSFRRAFKRFIGMTPSEFIKSVS